jgi:RNA polymerase sigma factor (sigma-70 family)
MAWAQTTQDERRSEGLADASLPYQTALRAFFRRRTDGVDIDDLIQEVLLRLHNRRGGQVNNLASFVFQTASNVLLDRGRRDRVRQRQAHCHLEDYHHPLDEHSPDRILEAKQEASAAMAALAELPFRTRAAFMLVRYEELSYKAAAAQLGISVSAVEKHVTKALRALSARLQDLNERQPPKSGSLR